MGWTNMEKWTWISTTRQNNRGRQETLHNSGSNLSIWISKEYLQREKEKVAKYRKLIEHELDQVECKTGEVTSIVIDSMDTIPDKINQELKRLGLTKQREALQMLIIKGSQHTEQ